jgi:hypothetical protein
MIETLEQWEEIKQDVKSNISTQHEKRLVELIEALRRFVRAHDKVDVARIGALTMDLKEYNLLVEEFTSARSALPDWITDD